MSRWVKGEGRGLEGEPDLNEGTGVGIEGEVESRWGQREGGDYLIEGRGWGGRDGSR